MDEFHQEDVTPVVAEDPASMVPRDETVAEAELAPVEPAELAIAPASAEPVAAPDVQQSITFDEIVAVAAADATPVGDVEATNEELTDEEATDEEVTNDSVDTATPDSVVAAEETEDLDDLVAALKDGAAPDAATAAAAEASDEPISQDADATLETLDDEAIAEETLAEEEAREDIEDEFAGPALVRNRLSTRLPAWIYSGVWVVFAGVMVYLLWPAANKPFVGLPYYAYMVIGGLALTVAGPIMALVTWLVARMGTTSSERIGLARAVWMRCMLATVFGVAVWWIALYALDLHRSGVIR